MLTPELTKERDHLVQQLKQYVPLLYQFFEVSDSIKDFSAKIYQFSALPVHQERQKIIRAVIAEKMKKLFGDDYVEKLNFHLDDSLAINIADHHQVLNHPFLVSSNIITSAHKFLQDKPQSAIFTLSSDSVPPNNFFSQFGFQFHGHRVPIFSNSEKEATAYYLPKREFNFVERMKAANRWNELTKEEQTFLIAEEKAIAEIDFSRCQDYSDQVTLIIQHTWPRLFAPEVRKNLPDLIYLTQEEIITGCLLKILEDDSNIISRALFDCEFQKVVLKNFRGIVTAWNEEEGTGTHFFWRKHPEKHHVLRLYVKDQSLAPADERYGEHCVDFHKDEIIRLLKNREIMPNLFLIFSVLNYYLGVRPLTGFGSTVYLELMRQAWVKTLEETGDQVESGNVATIKADSLTAGLALFFARENGRLAPLYANDIYYQGGLSAEYLQRALDMRFGRLLMLAIPDMYQYFANKYIPDNERVREMKITFNDLAEEEFGWIK